MNGKESNSKEAENNNNEDNQNENEDLEATTSNSDIFIEISTKEHYIQKFGIDPAVSPIFISYNAYRRIVGYAMRYGNEDLPQRNWREVYGILIGSIKENKEVIIKDAIPVMAGGRAYVEYKSKHYVDTAQFNTAIYERAIQDNKEDFFVGWWHTHPGIGFIFSPRDIETQLFYQGVNPYAIALVFDHCQKGSKSYYLGVAGIRLKNPDRGMFATYSNTIELKFEFAKEKMVKQVENDIKEIKKNIRNTLKQINFIDEVLRKKGLAQLQRNFGLIMVLKRDVKITDDEQEAEEDDYYLYEWDPDIDKKIYRIPKFREKIEKELKKCEEILIDLKKTNQTTDFKKKKAKFSKKIKEMLVKPNEWYKKILNDFTKSIEVIFPLFDYLDTDERKIIEHFEKRSFEYQKILDDLNSRSDFNL
ncbi:MAG: Mov34/MPN/PAD-1 family protein [Candidatus Lokiarchaeota archaeon]|nr:Mov34/MPN/PAD-1 family protein [Candidatus Lokiarchaeota archaeon]